jgi:hypothetical protein
MTIIKTHNRHKKKHSDKRKRKEIFLYNKKREDKFTDISSHKTSKRKKNQQNSK